MSDGLTPAELLVLCLLFVGFHVLALPYFIWAVRHRQFARDEEASHALYDDDGQPPSSSSALAAKPLSLRAILMLSLLAFLFLPTLLMSLFTVYEATHVTAGAPPAVKAPLKCPFGG